MDQPLVPPPPGVSARLESPVQQGQTAGFWVPGVGMVLSTAFLLIRVYTNTVVSRVFGVDDVSLIVAWVFSVAIQLLIVYLRAKSVFAVHIWDLTVNSLNYSLNATTIASILYCPFLAFAKFSILFLYLRLGPMRWFRIAIFTSMFVIIGANFALIFAFIFACSPIKRGWDVTITEGSCINRAALYLATAVLNMATDVILLVLPIPMVLRLQMPPIQKIGLLLIFAVGSATFITSCIRLVLLIPMLGSSDPTWAVSVPSIWVTVEANLVIICVALPAMRRFLRHVSPRLIGEHSRDQASQEPTAEITPLHTFGSGSKEVRGKGDSLGRMYEEPERDDSEVAMSEHGDDMAPEHSDGDRRLLDTKSPRLGKIGHDSKPSSLSSSRPTISYDGSKD